jgi:hypothetical protein
MNHPGIEGVYLVKLQGFQYCNGVAHLFLDFNGSWTVNVLDLVNQFAYEGHEMEKITEWGPAIETDEVEDGLFTRFITRNK